MPLRKGVRAGVKRKIQTSKQKLILVRLYNDEDDLKFSQSHILRLFQMHSLILHVRMTNWIMKHDSRSKALWTAP